MYFPADIPSRVVTIREKSKYTPVTSAVVPKRVIPVPRVDLTLFGGSAGNRRFYKAEKESIPEFSSRMDDQWHTAGDNIVLKVQYRGHPEPVVTWSKGQIIMTDTMRSMVTADGAVAELAIFDAQKSDGGYYTCRIENPMGVQETGCHVYIEEQPTTAPGRSRYIAAPGGNQRLYRSVLYTPVQRYSQF